MKKNTDRPDIQNVKLLREYQAKLKALHARWTPHPGQVKAAGAIFRDKKKIVQVQCGRKWGKTETGIYAAWRWAIMYPRSAVYIVYPERAQAFEVVWADRRLQDFGPKEFLADDAEFKSELRLNFQSGSFIKLEGSENFNRLRGYTPHFVIYDEYKDHHPQAHVAMKPNLVAKQAQLLILGTPPDRESHYTEMRNFLLEEMTSGNTNYLYIESPSWENPDPNIQGAIEEERRIATKFGKLAEFNREYGAQYIPGGASAIFPNFDRQRHIKSAQFIRKLIQNDRKKLNYYAILDPGTSTCFAALFFAHNPYTSELFILGEVYEKERKKTVIRSIWPRCVDIMNAWNEDPEKWEIIVDEGAASIAEEIMDRFGVYVSLTKKREIDKEDDCKLLDNVFAEKDRLYVNAECEWFPWEVENYVRKSDGSFPKNDDHLVDCLRYGKQACNYRFIENEDAEEWWKFKKEEEDEHKNRTWADVVREKNGIDFFEEMQDAQDEEGLFTNWENRWMI